MQKNLKKKKFIFFISLAAVTLAVLFIFLFFLQKEKNGKTPDSSDVYEQVLTISDNTGDLQVSSETPFFEAVELYDLDLLEEESAYIENIRIENNTIQVLVRVDQSMEMMDTLMEWEKLSYYFALFNHTYYLLIFDMDGNLEKKINISEFIYDQILILDILYFSDDFWRIVYTDIYDQKSLQVCEINGTDIANVVFVEEVIVEDVWPHFNYNSVSAIIYEDGSIEIAIVDEEISSEMYQEESMSSTEIIVIQLESENLHSSEVFSFEYDLEENIGFLANYFEKSAVHSFVLRSDKKSSYLFPQNSIFKTVYDTNGIKRNVPQTWLLKSKFISGNEEIIASNANGIYGIKPESGAIRSYAEWKDLDLSPGIKTAIPVDENRIFLCQQELDSGIETCRFYFLDRQTNNPNTGKSILRVGGKDIADSLELQQIVYEYNQGSKNVHAEILDYAFFDGAGLPPDINDKIEDLVRENPPDVIYDTKGVYDIVSNREIWKDLSGFVEQDENFIKSDYYENLLMLGQREEELPFLFSSFSIFAMIAESGQEEKTNWRTYLQFLYNFEDMYMQSGSFYKVLPYISDLYDPREDAEMEWLLNPFSTEEYIQLGIVDHEINMYDYGSYSIAIPSELQEAEAMMQQNLDFKMKNTRFLKIETPEEIYPSIVSDEDIENSQRNTTYWQFFVHAEIDSAENLNDLCLRLRDENMSKLSLYGYPSMRNPGVLCRPTSLFGIYENTNQEEDAWRFIRSAMEMNTINNGLPVKKIYSEAFLGNIQNQTDRKMMQETIDNIDRMIYVNNDLMQALLAMLSNTTTESFFYLEYEGVDSQELEKYLNKCFER